MCDVSAAEAVITQYEAPIFRAEDDQIESALSNVARKHSAPLMDVTARMRELLSGVDGGEDLFREYDEARSELERRGAIAVFRAARVHRCACQ